MSKSLVAYFSPTGSTKAVASTLAEAIGADLFEIVPEVPYKPGDLNWMDKNARSTIEMNDPDARPAIAKLPDVSAYDKIYVGFPIWWYVAPRIINTFLEGCELSGKTVIPFATSGSSGMGKTNSVLKPSCGGAKLLEGRCSDAVRRKQTSPHGPKASDIAKNSHGQMTVAVLHYC